MSQFEYLTEAAVFLRVSSVYRILEEEFSKLVALFVDTPSGIDYDVGNEDSAPNSRHLYQ